MRAGVELAVGAAVFGVIQVETVPGGMRVLLDIGPPSLVSQLRVAVPDLQQIGLGVKYSPVGAPEAQLRVCGGKILLHRSAPQLPEQ